MHVLQVSNAGACVYVVGMTNKGQKDTSDCVQICTYVDHPERHHAAEFFFGKLYYAGYARQPYSVVYIQVTNYI